MALTNAERQARFKAHHAGDHQLCPAGRACRKPAADAAQAPPPRRVRSAPAVDESVGPGRGAALPQLDDAPERPAARSRRREPWDGLTPAELWEALSPQLGAAHRVMLAEACRMKDRLDRLDAIIDGNEEWLRISVDRGDVVVAVDAALAEARQHATTLRGLLTDLVKALPKTPEKPNAAGGAGIASFAAAAVRKRATAG